MFLHTMRHSQYIHFFVVDITTIVITLFIFCIFIILR